MTPQSPKPDKRNPPRQKPKNPIESAITSWYEKHYHHHHCTSTSPVKEKGKEEEEAHNHKVKDLIAQAPKRWTAYGELVLLPSGSFTSSAWQDILSSPKTNTASLWKEILDRIPGSHLTHLAINEGIPLHAAAKAQPESENILRSPSGLRILHGDFGPDDATTADFGRAFWVSTKQNGITQTWAPRWTMFSRGNIKEKARLLDFHNPTTPTKTHRQIPPAQRQDQIAVDLYAGIGYFAFCYAALGFRVFCWEMNPWSVEGLRRGAEANGWSVRVVIPPSEREKEIEKWEKEIEAEIARGEESITVFLEDNTRAAGRIRRIDELTKKHQEVNKSKKGLRKNKITHINLGLLPTSQGSWATAWDISTHAPRTWFHVHENVGVDDIDQKKEEIRRWFVDHDVEDGQMGMDVHVEVEHVELVKTFAPGVWHCVFDVFVRRRYNTISEGIGIGTETSVDI